MRIMAQEVIQLICDHFGCMDYEDLLQAAAVEGLESVLLNSDNFTVLQQSRSRKTVLVTSNVRLCRARECQESCTHLHLCSFDLLGQCNIQRCKYGHSLETQHNSRVLREHGLRGLSKDQLRVLLLQNDNSLLPNVCVSYNKGSGEFGNCPEKEVCRRLHVCEKYIRGLCDGSVECNRCHDFYEPHPMKTLQARRVPSQLIGCLLLIYRNILTLKDHRNAREKFGAMSKEIPKTSNRAKVPEYLQRNAGNVICLSFIRGTCKYGEKCWRVHFGVPYKWEVEVDKVWVDLPNNEAIEREYSDPAKIHSVGNEPVCFDTMMVGVHRVRRLSTISSVLEPSFSHTTKWIWYWKNEYNKWIQYGSIKEMHRLSSITSEELEKKYLQFLDDNIHDVVKFMAGKEFYELNFKDMVQRNETTSTVKAVRRRPFFVSLFDVRTTRTSRRGPNSSSYTGVPGFWDKSAVPESGFQRVLLDASHKDYVRVQDHFNKTMMEFSIVSIERVQNKELWEDFQTKRERMEKANSEKKYREAERLLFHGTNTRNVDVICRQNFDMRVSGTNATVYGQGTYFARDAKYSHCYTDGYGERCMFACRVLVGQYTKGVSHYRRPPAKDPAGNLYDSCVNDVREPTIYVVFERSQIYPEFLITYKKSMRSPIGSDQALIKAKSLEDSLTNFLPDMESKSSAAPRSSIQYSPPPDGSLSGSFCAARSSENASLSLDDFVFNVRQTASVISTSSPHEANNSTSSSSSPGEELAQDVLASIKIPVSSNSDNQLLIPGTPTLTDRRDTDMLRPNPDLVTTQESRGSWQHFQNPASSRQLVTNFSDPLSAISSSTPRDRNLSLEAFPSSSHSATESNISVMYTPTSSSADEQSSSYGSLSSSSVFFNEKPPSPLRSTQTSQGSTSPRQAPQHKNVLEARSNGRQKCQIQ